MGSRKEFVTASADLRGEGRETVCTVRAVKTTLPGSHEVAYSKIEIVRTSEPLPDGVYELTLNKQSFRYYLHGGVWSGGEPIYR
jgi:hypothetical protein